ncbi:MAG TPA: hypothetical protein VFE10_13555 [Phenylobacterium sp.]|nr:hypothetical protein [Phenylobacterium sp.]
MITVSTRARIIGPIPDAMAWAHEIAGVVTKASGAEVQVAARIGGHSEVLWVSRYDDLAAFEASMEKIQGSADYDASVRGAISKGFFDGASIEQALWRTA